MNHPGRAPIDYSREGADRRRLTNYLRTGSFRKLSGSPMVGQSVRRRRLVVSMVAGLLFLIGLLAVFF